MSARTIPAWSRFADRASSFLAVLAGASLLVMVLVIAVGVVMRFVFASPILGSNEIVQIVSVGVVMLGLPHCTQRHGHVRVDVFDAALGRRGRLLGDVLTIGLTLVVFAVLVARAAAKALDAMRYGDATNMLDLPIWPLYALVAVGFSLCMAILALQLLSRLVSPGSEP